MGRVVILNPFDLKTVIGSRNGTLLGDSMVKGRGSAMAHAGVLIDPKNHRFHISWAFDGRPAPAQEIFSAVLDGIMTRAQHDTSDLCAHVTGVSFSTKIVFQIGRVDGQDLYCGQISRAFLLISHEIIAVERKFSEMDFTVTLDGKTIATGDIFRLSSLGGQNSNGIGQIAR